MISQRSCHMTSMSSLEVVANNYLSTGSKFVLQILHIYNLCILRTAAIACSAAMEL